MAGGVWNLSEWEDWIDNDEIGKIAFQFGTRPLLNKRKSNTRGVEKKTYDN